MSHLVCEAFNILEPEFPPALFSPLAIAQLRSFTPALASICAVQLGFECRLSDSNSQVDLLQCLIASRGHLQAFLHTIDSASATSSLNSATTWERLRFLCAQWCEANSSLSNGLNDLWLEFDVEAEIVTRPIPSVFVGLHPELYDWQQRFQVAQQVLSLLGAEAASRPALQRNLEHCFRVSEGRTCVSHVGIMLARQLPVVRVCVQSLPLAAIPAFLRDVQWPGDMVQIEGLLKTLEPLVDEVRLILDVGEQGITFPRLGLECFIVLGDTSLKRWGVFSQWLVEQGLCSSKKLEDLLDWHRPIMPPQTPVKWPEALIAESLLHSPEKLMVLDRQINHIKLDVVSPQKLEAKAYLGAGREWRTVPGK